MSVDTRAWNIIAGLCVATGCGGRTISVEEGGSETLDDTNTNTNTNTETGPECTSDSDCPSYGYYCYDGVCQYAPHHDGHLDYSEEYWYAECYDDGDCASLELCNFDYCESVASPLACPAPDAPVPVPIPDVPLALSFVDANGDGRDDIAVATVTDIYLVESGVDTPTLSPRGVESNHIDAMVGGEFDAMAGEDLVIMFDDMLLSHASGGDGSFAMPTVADTGWSGSIGLAAGEYDAEPLDDLFVWAESGASVLFAAAQSVALTELPVQAASARSLSDPVGGYVIATDSSLWFHAPDGPFVGSADVRGGTPVSLTSLSELGDGFDLSSSVMYGPTEWSLLQEWGPATGNAGQQWGVLGHVTQMLSGDFDNDARADLGLIIDGQVFIHFAVHDQGCLAAYPLDGVVRQIAIGDHDGDGDDELAVRSSTAEVWLIDAG